MSFLTVIHCIPYDRDYCTGTARGKCPSLKELDSSGNYCRAFNEFLADDGGRVFRCRVCKKEEAEAPVKPKYSSDQEVLDSGLPLPDFIPRKHFL